MTPTVAILGPTPRSGDPSTIGGVATHTVALADALRHQGVDAVVLSDTELASHRSPSVIGVRGTSIGYIARMVLKRPWLSTAVLVRVLSSQRRRALGVPVRRAFVRSLLVREALEAVRPDVLHIQQADFRALYAALAAYRVPTVLTVHGLGGLQTGEYPALREVIPDQLTAADAVVTPSRALMDQVRQLGVTPRRARVVPNAIDHELFRPIEKRIARELTGLDASEGPVLLYAGRVTEYKGAGDLLEAFPRIRHAHPDAQLVMVGPWGLDTPAPERSSGVLTCGGVSADTMPAWFSAATLTIVPSRYEGFGLVALESLACGTPVVASHTGGLPEVVPPGAGMLVPPRSPAALADAVNAALSDPEALSRMAAEARASAARFSWDATAQGFLGVYREILGGAVLTSQN